MRRLQKYAVASLIVGFNLYAVPGFPQEEKCYPIPIRIVDDLVYSPFYLRFKTEAYNADLSGYAETTHEPSIDNKFAALLTLARENHKEAVRAKMKDTGVSRSPDAVVNSICDIAGNDVHIKRKIRYGNNRYIWSIVSGDGKNNMNVIVENGAKGDYKIASIIHSPIYRLLTSFTKNEIALNGIDPYASEQPFRAELPLINETNEFFGSLCFNFSEVRCVIGNQAETSSIPDKLKGVVAFTDKMLFDLYNNNVNEALSKFDEKSSARLQHAIERQKESDTLEEYLQTWFSPKELFFIVHNDDVYYLFYKSLLSGDDGIFQYYVIRNTGNGFVFSNYHYSQGIDAVLTSPELSSQFNEVIQK